MSFLFKSFGNSNAQYKSINVQEYHTEYFKTKSDHVLVDVRTPGEFARGHLPGAVNIPLNEIGKRASEVPTGKPVIVVCASGNRSKSGSATLVKAGYEDVYNLQGGTMQWMMQGHPLEA